MADDILLTPEEQDERARQWLKDNGMALVLGVGLGLAAVFGYQTWQAKLQSNAEAASALYNQVLSAVQNSDLADISDQVETLKQNHDNSPYAVKAVLLRAKQLAVSDLAAAEEELAWAMGHAKESGLQHAARIRQTKVLIAQEKLDEARVLASQAPEGAFVSNYQELLGDIAVKQDNTAAAREHYQAAIDALTAQEAGYSAILELKLNRLPTVQGEDSVAAEPTTE